MASRLEQESAELARLMREASGDDQRRTADFMVRRVAAQFTDPGLVIPHNAQALNALVEDLDAHGDERDMFRRARAATAAQFLRQGDFEEAVYEALHANASLMHDSIAAARATLLR